VTTAVDPSTHPLAQAQTDLIAGEWVAPALTLPGALADPNTGEDVHAQMATDTAAVDRAIAAAHQLHEGRSWAATSLEQRSALLDAIAAGIEQRAEAIAHADAMSTGNPIAVARQMASYLAPRVRSARDQLMEVGTGRSLEANGRDVRVQRRPLGPAAVLAPWNAPTFVGIAKVASALAAGCPVVLKPSEWAPGGCQLAAEAIYEALQDQGLPAETFQLVHGGADVGRQVVSDPRIRAISFTGGTAGGRAVASAAAPHFTALQLELGGHNPAVVLHDADVQATATALVEGMTKLNGQWCEAPGKILVHRDLHDDLVDALTAQIATLTVGHCMEDGTDVGPLAHESHLDHLRDRIRALEDVGARALAPSTLPDLGGWFLSPTLVVAATAEQSTRELFGPVVSVHAMTDDQASVAASSGPEVGLAGFVFGTDLRAAVDAATRMPAGEVRINGCKLADLADGSEQSFWNNAGIGAHGPTDMVQFFQGRSTIGVDDPSLPI
jgi:phenylacetaldehyde dehydrogenase